jgi:hypothetical protein
LDVFGRVEGEMDPTLQVGVSTIGATHLVPLGITSVEKFVPAFAGSFGQLDDGLAILPSRRAAEIVGLISPAGLAPRWTN